MRFKILTCIFLFLCNSTSVFSFSKNDSLLHELSNTIENMDTYIKEKEDRIARLKNVLSEENLSFLQQFSMYNKLHYEYRIFQYDSAFTYALKLQEAAKQLKDPAKETYAKLKLCFTLLSSGMNKEALDSLNTIDPKLLPDSIKLDYYALTARAYYDLSGYAQDSYYSFRYVNIGESYVDSALAIVDQNSLQFYALRGMKRATEPEQSRSDYQTILDKFNPTLNEYAMAANSLGNFYHHKGNHEKAIEMMARAAIADIQASVKEGVALMTLASFLFNNGEEILAYDFIKQAMKDAEYYGARQRIIQAASILPVIEGKRLATVEGQRSQFYNYSIAMTAVSVLVAILIFIIFLQLKQLRVTKRTVTEANSKLQETNDKLQETNLKLIEANRIKEEYIGYSFNLYSEYIAKIEKLKKSIEKKVRAKKFDDMSFLIDSINLKKEREDLYHSFDSIFVKLFPSFVSTFNSFFSEQDKIMLKNNQAMNIELRIFALNRIGIHDYEQISKILEYSIRTIYNYKSKVKNRSKLSSEEFEKKLMEIKAF